MTERIAWLDRRGNANPITYQGGNGKQYGAVVATDLVPVYALPPLERARAAQDR